MKRVESMKKLFILLNVASALMLSGCSQKNSNSKVSSKSTSSVKIVHSKNNHKTLPSKINIHKKYKGFKLATVPVQYRGIWYRADPYSNKARKLVITKHSVNGNITYTKVDPNLRLNQRSEEQNKKYSGNIVLISVQSNTLKVRGFLDTVSLIYKLSQFNNEECIFMSYGTDDSVINGALFKDKKTALKYRKYDFTKVKD